MMQSRKDLYAAHRLMTQRASLALLRGQPDVPDLPMRLLNVAAFSGVLIALIAAVLLVIWGFIRPASVPLEPGHHYLVIDSDTGADFVFCEKDKLCPVVNYASARLALNVPNPRQETVTQSALRSHPLGPQIGIPGLPDPLPVASLLVRRPWSVCDHAGGATILAGGVSSGGRRLGNHALLVQAKRRDWVIWHGSRHAIAPDEVNVLSGAQPASVAPVWLNALPVGAPFAPPRFASPHRSVTGPAGQVQAGHVYKVLVAGVMQYYVQLPTGRIARITKLQSGLLQFDGLSATTLDPSVVSKYSSRPLAADGLPPVAPPVVAPAQSGLSCVVYGAAGSSALHRQVLAGGRFPAGGVATNVPGGIGRVFLPNGTGALVGSAPAPGSGTGTVNYYLVAGGRRYALANQSVAPVLGYQDLSGQAALLPAGVIGLIPQGPVLNPAAANRQVGSG